MATTNDEVLRSIQKTAGVPTSMSDLRKAYAEGRAEAMKPPAPKPKKLKESPIVKAAEKLASQHKAGAPNPLIAAAEKIAAASRG